MDIVTISKALAQAAARPRRGKYPKDGGTYDHSDDPPATGNPTPYNPGGVPSGEKP
jgi:hypothetical protein